jgi:tRNA(Leu) C34 or U34 (ribose-2'-O)-methylase TrmL
MDIINLNQRYEKLEELLYKLRRARWLHRRASKYYQPRNNFILGLSFMVSGSISVLSISNTDSANNNNNNQRQYIGYAITLIGFVNGLITLIANQLDYKTKINNNNLASKAYDRLITQVSFEINFPSTVPISEFVGLIEENILKLKNELEVMSEARFEKEINKMIDNGLDISSDAGYMPKKSFFDFFKKTKTHTSTLSDLGSEIKTTNPIKKHQSQKRRESEFIKQYKEKIIHETVLNNHPHFENQIPTNNCERSLNFDNISNKLPKQEECNIEINIEDANSQSHPIQSNSLFSFFKSFFSSSNKIPTKPDNTEYELKNIQSSPSTPITSQTATPITSQASTISSQSLTSAYQYTPIRTSQIVPYLSSDKKEDVPSSPRALPLSVFNMRKI